MKPPIDYRFIGEAVVTRDEAAHVTTVRAESIATVGGRYRQHLLVVRFDGVERTITRVLSTRGKSPVDWPRGRDSVTRKTLTVAAGASDEGANDVAVAPIALQADDLTR